MFRSNDCDLNNKTDKTLIKFENQRFLWIWKDNKDEYQLFLNTLNQTNLGEIIINNIIHECDVFVCAFVLKIDTYIDIKKVSWKEVYRNSKSLDDVYRFLNEKIMSKNFKNIVTKLYDYRISLNIEILVSC